MFFYLSEIMKLGRFSFPIAPNSSLLSSMEYIGYLSAKVYCFEKLLHV